MQQDKRFQTDDWRRRPLSPEQLRYARSDAHYLLYIAGQLRRELAASSQVWAAPVVGTLPASAVGVQPASGALSAAVMEAAAAAGAGASTPPTAAAGAPGSAAAGTAAETAARKEGTLVLASASAVQSSAPSLTPYQRACERSQLMTLQLFRKTTSEAAAAAAAAQVWRKHMQRAQDASSARALTQGVSAGEGGERRRRVRVLAQVSCAGAGANAVVGHKHQWGVSTSGTHGCAARDCELYWALAFLGLPLKLCALDPCGFCEGKRMLSRVPDFKGS